MSHHKCRPAVRPFIAAFAVGVLFQMGACAPIQTLPPSIDVSGTVRGADGTGRPVSDFVQSAKHTQPAPEPHLAFSPAPGTIQDVRSIGLAATASTGLPFSEDWHLILLSRGSTGVGAQPVLLEFTGDPGWVHGNVGELAWLIVRKNDVALPSDNFSNFTHQPPRFGGPVILARVEDDDPVLPWTRANCGPLEAFPLSASLRPLAPAGGVDCFDMQSLTSALLNNIAIAVTPVVHANSAQITLHRMAIVPHVPSTPVPGRAALPGFGFVYEATLEPVILGSGAGPFTGTLTISVPLTSHWLRDTTTGGLSTMLDPLSVVLNQTSVNAARVTVTARDGTLSAAFAESLRTSVAAAVTTAPMPTGPAGIPLTSFLDLLFTESLITPTGGLPANFSLLAIPENRAVAGTPQNIAMTLGPITFADSTPTTAVPGGRGARTVAVSPGGAVTVGVNLNAAGTSLRTFTLPAPAEPMPFKLVLLK